MIFVDSGAWVALAVPNDKNAPQARSLFSEIERGVHGSMVTTDFVLDEAVTFLQKALGAQVAVRFGEQTLSSRSLTLVWIDPARLRAALRLMQQNSARGWSFTDCTSFLVMQDLGIGKAFSFDPRFEQAGFDRLP